MKYDFIIVGGGTAGCVLASRLTEDTQRSVLVLEAGPDYPYGEDIPDDLKYSLTDEAYRKGAPHDWGYVGTATPQQAEPILIPRAKVMGGCSSHNGPGPKFIRGIPADYDGWASMGNDEWSFEKVLPYFKKLERDLDFYDEYHGNDGPMPVRRAKREEWLPFQEAFFQASVDAGFPEHRDMNHPDNTGVGPRPEGNIDWVRVSTALGYLDPARHRLNLTVRPNVLATRILFDGMRATGIEVESGGNRYVVHGGSIIVSAGAVASPQLLMLSGVGPANQLRGLGVPVVNELQGVGQNMRDHPRVGLRVNVNKDYQFHRGKAMAQVALRYTATGSNTPNDVIITPISFDSVVEFGGEIAQARGVSLSCILELADGVGELTLTTNDIGVQPHMDYRYLTVTRDMQRLRESVRICLKLLGHEAMRALVDQVTEPSPEDLASDDALDNWLLRNVTTSYHVSGTCKMGLDSDPMAVVDQHLRVHGMEGLRVVDASIMPDCIRANTVATTIMIGERVADLIKQQL